MNIPDKVKIAGITYKVIQGYDFDGSKCDLCGEVNNVKNEIRLGRMENSREKIESVFIHELFHAIDHVYNNDNLHEEVIDRIGQGFYQVFKDNKIF